MSPTLDRLPDYLLKYTVEQLPDRYTPRDHAVWRYIMRQNRAFFKDHAVDVYLKGLDLTGITTDRIPMIKEMDQKLNRLGWGAVPVCGFIPPAAFLEFQALKVLPIAFDMRSVDHVGYTPAPDIVHEAAGHAPILADPAYSEYLTQYAAMAKKAIFNKSDLDLYEAIRRLSDLKENYDSTPEEIAAADLELKKANARVTKISEASKVSRMNWWTVEYGLLGSLENPKIYGAGLLSSIRESQTCLSPKVKKIRLSANCVEQSYDITEPQPQLFVAENVDHLKQVLVDFEATLSYKKGGVYALDEGKSGATVTTTVLDSGLEISGIIDDYAVTEGKNQIEWVRWRGACQLSHGGKLLQGQGVRQHPEGFSTVLGRAQRFPAKPLYLLSEQDLVDLKIRVGQPLQIDLTTGVQIRGHLKEIIRAKDGKLLIFKITGCTVAHGGRMYFLPEWGEFDWGLGESIQSVSGGPGDRDDFGMYEMGMATTSPARQSPYTQREKEAFDAYVGLKAKRDFWAQKSQTEKKDCALLDKRQALLKDVSVLAEHFRDEWLLRLESLELAFEVGPEDGESQSFLKTKLTEFQEYFRAQKGDTPWLTEQGVALFKH